MQVMLVGVVMDILNPTTRTEALASPQTVKWQMAMDSVAHGKWHVGSG
ncbi:hypothetical protein PF005_g14419 [Phytophthora fragariae]|uniref:Uncharacterized protein n=1 Tax=Phytophthora fragariae TaxID=53985 RepID=A0A6A3YNV5_9STRA|nr:hypothetical protein PF003_g6555 [Phytophthora fragariae]KAE8934484.1 hypothetical protein PF009_g15535 [Phytophthora fragariae]KAE9007218.1 hypothetical protein PF011_g11227 [Phytophthora fragariae]KAE9092677.1 hypothetical protein PF007_g18394 [Phytophthora fragariae]KAE9107950.1 hypothetical protein PF010_g12086 [Phytophthora fragariae]